MGNPARLIEILSEQTAAENLYCDDCKGLGEIPVPHPETGTDVLECAGCLGTGYNQLGLILQGILKPPPEGYGPVELREALATYLTVEQEEQKQQAILEQTYQAISEVQEATGETQRIIEQAQALLAEKEPILNKANRLQIARNRIRAEIRRIS